MNVLCLDQICKIFDDLSNYKNICDMIFYSISPQHTVKRTAVENLLKRQSHEEILFKQDNLVGVDVNQNDIKKDLHSSPLAHTHFRFFFSGYMK